MKISIIIGITGILILVYSFTLEPYSNTDEFYSKYMEMKSGQSENYYRLREDLLTPKFRLQDTGITLILLSIIAIVIIKKYKGNLLTPSNKSLLVAIAFVLPFLTVAGYLFDIFQGMNRDEFPKWSDSLGIPLMGVPFIFIALLIWALLHLLLVKEVKDLPISFSYIFKLSFVILFVSAIALVLILITLFFGQYWYSIPGLLWLYYYLSVGVNQHHFKATFQ